MATPGRDLVLFEPLQNGVGLITLNNPEWLNAYTKEMGQQYFDILDRLAVDGSVRAVVVTGAGKAFCAGADTSH